MTAARHSPSPQPPATTVRKVLAYPPLSNILTSSGVTKLLLEEAGIKPDTKDRNGETPLFLAARGGHHAIITMLLQRGGSGSINLNARQMFSGLSKSKKPCP